MSSLVPNFDLSLPTTCPIDLGTSPAGEALRWGPKAKAAMLAASAARRARMARRIAVEVVKLLEAPPVVVPVAPRGLPLICNPEWQPPPPTPAQLAFQETMRAYREASRTIPVQAIQMACAAEFRVTLRDIISARRTHMVVVPRQVGMYLSRHLTTRSFPEIGRLFGGKDHTSVMHAERKIAAMIDADPVFASRVQSIRERIEAER